MDSGRRQSSPAALFSAFWSRHCTQAGENPRGCVVKSPAVRTAHQNAKGRGISNSEERSPRVYCGSPRWGRLDSDQPIARTKWQVLVPYDSDFQFLTRISRALAGRVGQCRNSHLLETTRISSWAPFVQLENLFWADRTIPESADSASPTEAPAGFDRVGVQKVSSLPKGCADAGIARATAGSRTSDEGCKRENGEGFVGSVEGRSIADWRPL
jgi:hypothetical protein